jgi:GntR family transcriptional regulator
MTRLESFSSATMAEGHQPGSRLLSLRQEKVVGHLATALQLQPGTWVWLVERLRLADDDPIGTSTIYLNLPPHISLSPSELEQEGSLWSILQGKGLNLSRSDETIQAVAASKHQADLLQVEVGAPLLLVEGTVYTDQAVPVEYHRTFNRGDRYKYKIQVIR